MSYEIGYRRPPRDSQFKKGSSGNPKGRPKGSRNLTTLVEQELSRRVVVTETGRRKSVTRLQAIVMRIVAGAVQGDPKQVQLLVGLLGRNGPDEGSTEDLLPDNYRQLLADYVAAQAAKGGVK